MGSNWDESGFISGGSALARVSWRILTKSGTDFSSFTTLSGPIMPSVERRICPPEFQQRLTQAVGINQYGEPLFKIAWGGSETYTAGGVWPHDHFFGYRQLMLSNSSPTGKGQPCWMILEWHPPSDYDTDAVYYYQNRDDATGLQTLGEYPYKGRYEVAFKLVSQEFHDGKMRIVNYHLDGMILDILIPAIVEAQKMTMRQRLRSIRLMQEREEKAQDRTVDAIYNNRRKHALPSQISDRERLIQKQMSYFLKQFGRVQPGFSAGKFAA